jgi:hypothetical protein
MILQEIQSELKAPKNQVNKFANYNYRSCEDILEALKPILEKHKCAVTISDTMEAVGDRVYVRAMVTLFNKDGVIAETTAYAREALTKKGQDDSQLTGSTSSYARKYALNGLFCIDDTKDSDATNKHGKEDLLGFDALINKYDGAKSEAELKAIRKKYDKDGRACSSKEKEDLNLHYTSILEAFKKGAV